MPDETKPESVPPPAQPISHIPQPVPATTTAEQPKFDPHVPQFAPVKHPLRFAIPGKMHLIEPLKKLITDDANIPDHYKALFCAELDSLKSNAAQIDLHVVDHADGGISIQGHIKPVQLG